MTDIQHNEDSHYTQSRTQKSPSKQQYGAAMRNLGLYSHNSNFELSYMKLKEQSKKQKQSNQKQIELLKEELYRKNQEIDYLKSVAMVNLRKDLNEAERNNIKNFKQNERQARQIQKLRTDNFNMQQDLEKQSKQRRTYLSKLDDLKQLKQSTKRQILQKDKIIRTYTEHAKKIQKQLAACKLDLQDLKQQLSQKQNRLFESQNQYKAMLQKSFLVQSQLKSLQLNHRNSQLMIHSYKQKINQLQRQKEQLLDRIQQNQSRSRIQSQREPVVGQVQMLEVKSLLEQIYNLIQDKKTENKQINKKYLASVACLARALQKK